ncbi:ATP-binding cassette domain-containing protein [Fulvivirga ligni]|uniref:ATP-binding cassette domain-containing protein n=1 Tax=Fulvivirga ligni TaxID=2904246 RepID=UPI001F46CA77|nr:ATP-binding cassette domain-containing protein [Fulvivirga ligni]UII20655.1 ATP-binding cassette domain-containing protein [Fulvivirga ligni]
MSESVLKTIIQLFAIVAKEDSVTVEEKRLIEAFLKDHLNKAKVETYLQLFEEYSESITHSSENQLEEEHDQIKKICQHINSELTQKQKVVIILELIAIILADSHISDREEELVRFTASLFNIPDEEVSLIESFVTASEQKDIDNSNILIISREDSTLPKTHFIGRSALEGLIFVLHISTADTYVIKYLGTTDLYLNGVPIKNGKINVLGTGSTIKADKVLPIYYGDILGHFINSDEANLISFHANNLSFKFKNGKLGLRDISIQEESGKLVGLMGASGAGKSTLLNVLNGNETPTDGQVLINGVNIHTSPEEIEGVIGFVPQDDLLIEDLTVYQNLYFAAKLCFAHLTDQETEALVTKTLSSLGLLETKDLKVGSPLEKTISGGQRKRLNIGLELLREPSVLFVDEPTSGLSSRDSENIMDLLKELSLKGKLVFVVIHQPSSDIFKMFDKLVILDTGGYQIYYGNPVEAVVYFKEMIELINSEQGECLECGNVNPEQIFNIIETKVVNEYGNFTTERKISPVQWNQMFIDKQKKPLTSQGFDNQPHSTLKIPSRFKQFQLFARRDVFSKMSNKQYLLINLLEAPILAFILAYIVRYFVTYHTTDPEYLFSKNLNIPAYLFMSIIVALFMGLTVSAEEIIRDRKILKRESFLHLSRSSYLFSKIAILFTLSAIQTFTFVLVGNGILEIKGMLLTHWMILFSTSCFANVLGLNISSAFNSAVTIYILIPILLIPQLLLSGVVVKFDKLNPDLSHTGQVPLIGDLMASRWAFEASMVSQFKDNTYESQFYTYDKIMAQADYKKIYYIPTLETKLEYCLNNHKNESDSIQTIINENLELLSSEISGELKVIGEDKFDVNVLQKSFSYDIYESTSQFLKNLHAFYSRRYNKADKEKDRIITGMTETIEERNAFDQLKNEYHNEAIADIVKNQNDPHRIIESEGQLIQKVFPIYKDPDPSGFLDYGEQFYVPKKHLFNRFFDTVVFNIAVIWMMSIFLIISLYFDVLRKIVTGMGK